MIFFNLLLIGMIVCLLIAVKKWMHGKRAERLLFLIVPLLTILCHYSLLLYHVFVTGDAIAHIRETPNLILPLYPCNVVMWCALFYGLLSDRKSKLALFLSDYIFWFGLISTLVGMFANVDFIMNPTLKNFEVSKSILAHAILLFNLLLIPAMGAMGAAIATLIAYAVLFFIRMINARRYIPFACQPSRLGISCGLLILLALLISPILRSFGFAVVVFFLLMLNNVGPLYRSFSQWLHIRKKS